MRVETILPGTFAVCAFFIAQCVTKCLTLKMNVKAIQYEFQWQIMLTSVKVMTHFSLALTVSKMLTFKKVLLENVGQGHNVQHSNGSIRWEISIIKVIVEHISPALTVLEIFTFEVVRLENADQGRNIHSQWHHSMANT